MSTTIISPKYLALMAMLCSILAACSSASTNASTSVPAPTLTPSSTSIPTLSVAVAGYPGALLEAPELLLSPHQIPVQGQLAKSATDGGILVYPSSGGLVEWYPSTKATSVIMASPASGMNIDGLGTAVSNDWAGITLVPDTSGISMTGWQLWIVNRQTHATYKLSQDLVGTNTPPGWDTFNAPTAAISGHLLFWRNVLNEQGQLHTQMVMTDLATQTSSILEDVVSVPDPSTLHSFFLVTANERYASWSDATTISSSTNPQSEYHTVMPLYDISKQAIIQTIAPELSTGYENGDPNLSQSDPTLLTYTLVAHDGSNPGGAYMDLSTGKVAVLGSSSGAGIAGDGIIVWDSQSTVIGYDIVHHGLLETPAPPAKTQSVFTSVIGKTVFWQFDSSGPIYYDQIGQ